MSNAGAAETRPHDETRPRDTGSTERSGNPLVEGRILPTLVRLAAPNAVALVVGVIVLIAETSYVGRLGTAPLAAIALMFPIIMLMMTMSGGAMGGGITSAISRALGAGDPARASTLAVHALVLGLCIGLIFSVILVAFGDKILALLGGSGRVLGEAHAFLQLFAFGVVVIWLMNSLAAILRGTGNMRLPSLTVLTSAVCQIVIGGALSLGLGGFPQLGIRGIAIGQVAAFSLSAALMSWYILAGRSPISLVMRPLRLRWSLFVDILRVGAVACFYPVQGVLTIGLFTSMLSQFGPEVLAGYSIGARLEFMVTSIAFATGVASAPMVGMAIGAGRVRRARRVAWIAAAVSFVGVGILALPFAIFPDAWVHIFTDDAGVRDANRRYLSVAAPMYPLLGVGVALYFASQGAAKVLGSVFAQSGRLLFVFVAGWLLTSSGASSTAFFLLAGAAMVVFGLLSALTVWITPWGTEREDPRSPEGTA
jgi:putative MATE family efflux protein